MGKENLVQYKSSLTPEERRERASVAGKASGVARQKRKLMRDVLSDLMGAELQETEIIAKLDAVGLPNTQEAALCYAAVKRAQSGDIEACRFVRDTLGEKPTEGLSIKTVYDQMTSGDIDDIDLRKLSNEELNMLAKEIGYDPNEEY